MAEIDLKFLRNFCKAVEKFNPDKVLHEESGSSNYTLNIGMSPLKIRIHKDWQIEILTDISAYPVYIREASIIVENNTFSLDKGLARGLRKRLAGFLRKIQEAYCSDTPKEVTECLSLATLGTGRQPWHNKPVRKTFNQIYGNFPHLPEVFLGEVFQSFVTKSAVFFDREDLIVHHVGNSKLSIMKEISGALTFVFDGKVLGEIPAQTPSAKESVDLLLSKIWKSIELIEINNDLLDHGEESVAAVLASQIVKRLLS